MRPEELLPLLRGRFGRPYTHLAVCDSTQRQLDHNAPEGAVVATDEQTAGRGRLGRSWKAPPGSSLLFSIVLRPRVPGNRLPELSVIAGRSVAEAIEGLTRLPAEVKLPNDVLVGGKKVAGILAEGGEGRVVVGVGINVHQGRDELPTRIDPAATSLDLETSTRTDRRELVVALSEHLERHYDAWLSAARQGLPEHE
jgi:BirA family transcriptional regulator, biotin operon repressor / biotin---[acetyl-CoA-carboxylase] ligase